MSKEKIVLGAVLCFASGVVLTQPPEFWQEVFSLPRLIARWLDAGVLACAGLWLGVVWAGRKDAALAGKVDKLEGQVTLLTQQMTGVNTGMAQFANALNEHTKILQAMQPTKP